jgi:polyisoprenoid-binding protein YceI
MRNLIITAAIIGTLASCADAPNGEKATTTDTQAASAATGTTYNVNNSSTVGWYGATPTHGHDGTFGVSAGTLSVENGNITGGNFTIDVTKMTITDKDTNGSYELVGHMLSPDFFDATKYTTAKFVVTKCEVLANDSNATHTISGNLTLKDSTKNVSFPAKVTVTPDMISAIAKFNIDRTQWGMFYGNDKSLKDKFIYPEVKISLNITGKKS